MARHKQNNVVYNVKREIAKALIIMESGHKYEDKNVSILDTEPKWFERGEREAVHVNTENPALDRSGGLRHNLSLVYNPVIRKIPGRLNNKGINTADSPNPGEIPPDRAEEATRTSRETVLQ